MTAQDNTVRDREATTSIAKFVATSALLTAIALGAIGLGAALAHETGTPPSAQLSQQAAGGEQGGR